MKNLLIMFSMIVALLAIAGCDNDQPNAKEQPTDEHLYASWETMEFDKCVSAWLIVRFIDADARFVLHPSGTDITEGVVFDVPGAAWSRQHRKCTSECILETIQNPDETTKKIVAIAHQIELNFWQIDSFPEARQVLEEVREIFESTPDKMQCFVKTREYFDRLYEKLKESN